MLRICYQNSTVHEAIRSNHHHGHIIKWTQHSAYRLFNIGWDRTSRRRESREQFKRRVARILCLPSLAKFDYSLHFYFYERKQNKCVHVVNSYKN